MNNYQLKMKKINSSLMDFSPKNKNRNMKKISLYILTLFFVTFTFAQDASFTASVDKTTVAADEQFGLEFILNGASGGKNFKLPDLSKFMVLSGPNQSTSMQFINGVVSSSVTYSYVLQPKEAGKFTIGEATIESGGKQYKSQPIQITVTKSGTKPKQQASGNTDDVQIGDNLFLRAVVDKSRVYQGEQITVTYKIYTRVQVGNYSINKLPAMIGFWSEDLEVPQQINLTTETIEGKQYRVGTLKKVALFPTQNGTLEITPLEIICQVQVQSKRQGNDIFDQFFNDPFFGGVQTKNVGIKNPPVKITVLPLPQENVPNSFKGAVGKYSFNTTLNKNTAKTNEPLSLKATISGTGNIKTLEAPNIVLPNDFEKYDPKVSDDIKRSNGIISGTKSLEWLIVPRYPGEKKIPSMEFSYFDVGKKKYVTLKSPEYTITVDKGNAEAAHVSTNFSDVKFLNQDIRYIKTSSGNLQLKGTSQISFTTITIITILPLFAFIGLFVYRKKTVKERADVVTFRSRKALKEATKRLKEAKILLSSEAEKFYAEVSRALWMYVADKLAIDRAELSIDNVTQKLSEKSLPIELVTQTKECLEACEFARFAPASSTQEEKQKMYETASNIIVSMEKNLNQD